MVRLGKAQKMMNEVAKGFKMKDLFNPKIVVQSAGAAAPRKREKGYGVFKSSEATKAKRRNRAEKAAD